ncbi:Protein of unknown function [Gryllus bimaculatus]|nr:Protein of unknown function [Gryllus bimaculatus]
MRRLRCRGRKAGFLRHGGVALPCCQRQAAGPSLPAAHPFCRGLDGLGVELFRSPREKTSFSRGCRDDQESRPSRDSRVDPPEEVSSCRVGSVSIQERCPNSSGVQL